MSTAEHTITASTSSSRRAHSLCRALSSFTLAGDLTCSSQRQRSPLSCSQAKCMKPSKMGKPEEDHQYHEPPGLWNVNWSYVSKEERKQAERHGGPARDQAALLALYADASAEYYRDDCQKQQRGKGNGDGSSTDPFQHFCAAFLVYSPLGTYIVPTQVRSTFILVFIAKCSTFRSCSRCSPSTTGSILDLASPMIES